MSIGRRERGRKRSTQTNPSFEELLSFLVFVPRSRQDHSTRLVELGFAFPADASVNSETKISSREAEDARERTSSTHRQILFPLILSKLGTAYSAQIYISRNLSCPQRFSGSVVILTCNEVNTIKVVSARPENERRRVELKGTRLTFLSFFSEASYSLIAWSTE